LHVGAVAMTVDWLARPAPSEVANPAAVMLELAPLPAAPEPVSVEAPPAPHRDAGANRPPRPAVRLRSTRRSSPPRAPSPN